MGKKICEVDGCNEAVWKEFVGRNLCIDHFADEMERFEATRTKRENDLVLVMLHINDILKEHEMSAEEIVETFSVIVQLHKIDVIKYSINEAIPSPKYEQINLLMQYKKLIKKDRGCENGKI